MSLPRFTNHRLVAALMSLVMLACLAPLRLAAQSSEKEDEAKPSETSTVRIELTGGETKKPIVDASVYLKFTEGRALRDRKIELNLKTNQNGMARSPGIPKGRVLIQVVAPGWKTYGQYFEIDKDEQTIQINLDRPTSRWLQQ